jgi:hypothetical protein
LRIQLKDPAERRDLSAFLRARVGAIVDETEPSELEVSLLGSYGADAMHKQIELAVKRWSFVRRRPEPRLEAG